MKLNYRLFVGDAEKALKMLPDRSVHLVVTSPPYYVMRGEMAWNSLDEYFDKMRGIFEEVVRVVDVGRMVVVNMSDYIVDGERLDLNWMWHGLLKDVGLKWMDTIIWEKTAELTCSGAGKMAGNFIKHKLPMYYSPDRNYEVVMVFCKGKKKRIPRYSRIITEMSKVEVERFRDFLKGVWHIHTRADENHPAVFPEKLPEMVIRFYSYYGETVLDPFLGTGTTMVAAKKLGRSCVGCEIEQKYISIIKRNVGWNEMSLGNVEYSYEEVVVDG